MVAMRIFHVTFNFTAITNGPLEQVVWNFVCRYILSNNFYTGCCL